MTARPPFLLDKPSVGRLLAIGPGGRLGHMKSRALLVLAALLAAPAWSQEFDLHSESITKIVRNVAESQSVAVQLSEEKPVARDPFADIEYVPLTHAPPVQPAAPQPAASRSSKFLSALTEILVDEVVDSVLDAATDDSYQEQSQHWVHCETLDVTKATTTTPSPVMCPAGEIRPRPQVD